MRRARFAIVMGLIGGAAFGAACDDATTAAQTDAATTAAQTKANCKAGEPRCSASVACEPLATRPAKTIGLGKVFAAGRDPDDGAIYVIADVESAGPRVFVGDEKQLVRKRVLGSGSSVSAGEGFVSVGFEGDQGEVSLAAERSAGMLRMATFDGNTKVKATSFDALEGAHALETLATASVANRKALDLPGEVFVEYVAQTQAGKTLVVVRPNDDWGYEDWRVFYGTRSKLLERVLYSASRGSQTFLEFDLDGQRVAAHFVDVFLSDDGGIGLGRGPAELEQGGTTEPLTLEDNDKTALGDAQFVCLP